MNLKDTYISCPIRSNDLWRKTDSPILDKSATAHASETVQVNKADFVLFMGQEKSWDFGKPEDLYNLNHEYKMLLDKQNEMEEILNER